MAEASDLKTGWPLSLWIKQWSLHNDKARIFGAILSEEISSRRDVVRQMGIRSTSVSEYVAALLALRLVSEMGSDISGRGRPTLHLKANPNRLLAKVFMVVSQSLHGFYVNLSGEIILHESVEAPHECDNKAITGLFRALNDKLLLSVPDGSKIAGTAFSISGLVNAASAEWVFAARWPQMHRLKLGDIFPGEPILQVSRSMDAELSCHLVLSEESTLLLHWGYGIGMAFGQSAETLAKGDSGFGEIGHWRVAGIDEPCRCGRHGCLETRAALWAIGQKLLGKDFNDGDDEEHFAELLKSREILALPAMKEAVNHMVLVLANVCRTFFPRRVIVTGPFVMNPAIWDQFSELFKQESFFCDLPQPQLIAGLRSRDLGVLGVAAPILEQGLFSLLSSPSRAL